MHIIRLMSASVGCTIEKYMGRRRSKEEYKMLEAVLSSTSNRIAISEKFRIIMSSNRSKRGFYFTFYFLAQLVLSVPS